MKKYFLSFLPLLQVSGIVVSLNIGTFSSVLNISSKKQESLITMLQTIQPVSDHCT